MAARKKIRKKTAKKATKKKIASSSRKKQAKKKTATKKRSKRTTTRPKMKKERSEKRSLLPRRTASGTSLLGRTAPSFTLPTGDGYSISLSDFRGQRVLLYFYPKDDTPGCTQQACGLRNNMPHFAKTNTAVIGVSRDDVASHRRFKDKHKLNFILASDKETGVCEKYAVWVEKNMYGRKYMGIERSTFLIDENGLVRGEWRKVKVGDHVRDVRAALAEL